MTMGREVKRVPLDFSFPLDESFAETVWCREYEVHKSKCKKEHHDECDLDYDWSKEVPKGDGWQLWQTVSDGPISPVFATADALIDWMCQPVPRDKRPHYEPSPYPRSPWAQGWRREIAEPFVKREGWAPSAVFTAETGMILGAEAVVRMGGK
jgi:hypothetical protein